ncbi:hypothetical protein BSZ36_18085 [Rubricoccus marinus]|uniref:Uncharacterized protein n=1 Tax=Rubricoccus marinus TaxID=716817 RepID=A0A259TUB6_9BACT|nr:hypothetical protein BSZ36_18085 [Rubricoccus marinus]
MLAWITLGDDEALFLEAAEDIDLRRDGQIVTGQVKDTPDSSLSLGTQEARTALKHFWRHRAWNPQARVFLRYLTRARRAHEQTPLGSGRRGLDVWDLALHDDDALRELRTYLHGADLRDAKVSPDLHAFLRAASDTDLREHLVSRVQWDTDAPDHGDLKGLVSRHLALHGRRHGILPSLATSVAESLFTEAIETASAAGDRRLTQDGFLSLFEDRTVGLQPAADRATIAATAAQLAATTAPQRTPGDPGFLDVVEGSPLASALPRSRTIESLLARLAASPLVAVHGSSGMGKSTLADLAAAASPAPWVRLDLRGLEGDSLADRLDEAALAVASLRLGTVVVADDLAPPQGRAESALRRLFVAVRARQGRLVVTAHSPLPHGLAVLVDGDPNVAAPPLDEDDLRHLALNRGCPPGQASAWATLALIRSSGHPLLADVYAREAVRAEWPPIRPEDLTAPVPPLAEAQRDARRRLRDALPADAADLVMRLSVFTIPFTRVHALRLAHVPPPISAAGDGLDRLIGPWIEPYGPLRYRVSPLLKGAFATDLPPSLQTQLHTDAADALLDAPFTAVDISGVLSHGILGNNGPALFNAYAIWSQADESVREGVAPYIDWFPAVGTGGAYALVGPGDPTLSLTLRSLQFELATASGRSQQALAVLDAWERDLTGASGLHPEAQALFELQLRTHLAINLEVPVPIERAAEAAQALLATDRFDPDVAFIEAPLADGTPGLLDHLSSSTLAEFLDFRCTRAPHLTALLNLDLREPLRSAVEDALRQRYALTVGIVGRVWSNESLEDAPDWPAVLSAFELAGALARTRRLDALLTAVAIGQATVHAEYLSDTRSAFDVLDAADASLPTPDPRVAAYRAKVHAYDGDHEQALAVFETVLPRWREVSDNDALCVPGSSLAYDFSDAIRSAGALGRYADASQWAALGVEAAEPLAAFVPSLRIGYVAERALARALDRDVCGAVELLAPVLNSLPPPETSILRKLHRRLTVLIAWLEETAGGRAFGFSAPELGQISRTDEDEFDDVDLMSLASLWSALGEAERHAECGTDVLERARSERASAPDHISTTAGFFSDTTDLVQNAPSDLPNQVARLLHAAQVHLGDTTATESTPPLSEIPQGTHTLVYLMSLATTGPFARGEAADLPLHTWREQAEVTGADMSLVNPWIGVATLAVAHTLGDTNATPHLRDAATSPSAPAIQWTASLALTTHPSTQLEHLYALAFLVEASGEPPFRPAVARSIATLAGVEPTSSHRDGVHAAAEAVLRRPRASQLPLAIAIRLATLANGGDRQTDPAAPEP